MKSSLGGLLLGFTVFYGLVLVSFTAIQKSLTPDQLFEPATFVPSDLMKALSPIVIAIAAILGGFTCAFIAGSRQPAYAFAGVLGALGVITILFTLTSAPNVPKPRLGDETPEVMMDQAQAHKPSFAIILEPVLAVAGVLFGSRLKRTPRIPR
ncbi:hypothetical protein BH11PLA2_BH11PLA2_19820 [soil metagenome]